VLLEDFLVNGDSFYFCDVLAESVFTVCYYVQLFPMAKLVATQMSFVHSFIYMWCIFMYLDGTLVILTTGKVKLCLGVASQHKYVRFTVCTCGDEDCASQPAAENVATCVVLGRANIGGEYRQCVELF